MEGFRIDPKTFLGLAKPNQCSQSVRKQISSWFWGDIFGPKSPNLHDPYSTTVLYDRVEARWFTPSSLRTLPLSVHNDLEVHKHNPSLTR